MRSIRRATLATVTAQPTAVTPRETTVARPTVGRALRRAAGSPLLLIPIAVLALCFRLYGLKWDDGYHLHPDERFISIVITDRILPDWPPRWRTLLQPENSPLNPRSNDPITGQPRDFAYGSLPLFVTKAVGGTMRAVTGTPWTDYDHIVLVGRALSAILDIGTLLIVAALARRYGRRAANFAAFLYAGCVLPIQLAHFFATDTWTTFFATAAILCFVRGAERERTRDFAAGGALTGAAIACKASVAFLAFPALVAVGMVGVGTWRGLRGTDDQDSTPIWRSLYLGLTTLWAALITFALAEPYALPRIHTYLTAIGTQARMVRGQVDFPYTRQYVGTGPLYHLSNLVHWGMGPALGLLVLCGLIWGVARVIRVRRPADLVLVAWILPYLLYTAPQSVKFMRYLLPLYPALIVLGVVLLRDTVGLRRLARWGRRSTLVHTIRLVGRIVTAVVAVCALLWAVAFASIYSKTHSRVAASEWAAAHIPSGATVATEVWDDGFPLPVPGVPGYNCVRLNAANPSQCTGIDLYPDEGTGETRLRYLAQAFTQSDYIVMSSDTIWASIPHLPWRYPVTIRYYDLLFADQLGFTKVYDGQVEPHLGPWRIDDQGADQSFSYYDHPRVLIFQKQRTLTLDELRPLFADALAVTPLPQRDPPGKSLMLNQPVETLPAVGDRAWGGTIARHGFVAVPLYLILFELFGLIAWPFAARLFGRFPDRGWGMAKLIGWLVCAWTVWFGASVHVVSFTVWWCALTLVIGGAVAACVYLRWRTLLVAALRRSWRVMLAGEATFLAGFALFLAFRLKNPDLWQTYWGGEKPFEMAHLSAILRSAHFPPYDPWFAGGYINYYYFGSYLHAFVMKLTGIAPEIAFNIAVPITMALVWGAAFSVGAALWAMVRRRRSVGTSPIAGGIASALAVGLFGNLDAAGQILGSLRDGLGLRAAADRFDFWQSTRIIPGTINEFPFFSGLWADLHAHVMALPFTILMIGIAVAIGTGGRHTATTSREAGATAPFVPRVMLAGLIRQVPWAALGVAALVAGALYCTNAWDFPTALALIALGLVVRFRQCGAAWIVALGGAAVGGLLVGAGAYLLFLPFITHFQAVFGSLARTRIPSPLGEFLVIFGLPILVIGIALTCLRPARGWLRVFVWDRFAAIAGVLGTMGTVAALITHRYVIVVVLPILCVLAVLFVRAEGQQGRRMAYGFAGVALALLGGIEVVFLADDLQGGDWERMNTVFKFDYQAWTLAMLAAIALIGVVVDRWRATPAALRSLITSVLVVGTIASLFYPIFGTMARQAVRMPPAPQHAGLDGFAWMKTGTVGGDLFNNTSSGTPIPFADDLRLIDWLNATVHGTPVIAEASIGPYRGNGSRISSATGLPTIIGWERHEEQQRDRTILPQRVRDVRTIYTSNEPAAVQRILDSYHVQYIVVGDVERRITLGAGDIGAARQGETYASATGLATLDRMVNDGSLLIAWQSGDTILYEVMGGWRAGGGGG